MATYGPMRRFLDLQHTLSWDPTELDPLTDRSLRTQPDSPSKLLLAPHDLRGALDGLLGHKPKSNAYSATNANAQAVTRSMQTSGMVSVDTHKTFWTRLIEAWDAQGLPTSQLGIARKLKMSQGSVGRWARDEGLPELDKLREIALLGKVSTDWLLTGRGPKRPISLDEETAELLGLWEQLEPNGRHSVRVAAQGALALQEKPVRTGR